ncbi:MAG TPA: DUF359 domain-containing protein, partial [archaeon]|nr:DUF359 domain-containing protein [archaeon]
IVDIQKLNREIKKLRKDLVIQSHYSHELDSDIIIVLRAETKELRKRLEKRGWPEEKIRENLEAEIFEVCKDEALQKTKKVFEVDTTEGDPEKTAKGAMNIIFRETELKKDLKLDERFWGNFKRPYGRVFSSVGTLPHKLPYSGLLISIGDHVSYNLIQDDFDPDIIVVDSKVNRKPFKEKILFRGKNYKAINRPGTISRSLWQTVRKAIKSGGKIKISVVGEEDLAVLPAVIMAPLGSLVLYGQPELVFEGEKIKEGVVVVYVDLEKKKDAMNLLKKMQR